MDAEIIRNYCLNKKCVTEGFPFGEDVLVFKVHSKIFCLCNLNPPVTINLKCSPDKAIELREKFEAVIPGYHMNKKHWNSLIMDGSLQDSLVFELIDHSYQLVISKLSQAKQRKLKSIEKNS